MPPLTYVVLDPSLQQAEPARFDRLFADFATRYLEHFSGDQAESTAQWSARICDQTPSQPAMRIVVAVERADGTERVIGGIAIEYYRAAGCALATYLYVADEEPYRHRGHARALLERARAACRALGPVRVVLAEAEWPDLLESPAAAAHARVRLLFFARIGARVVGIDYVQPALGAGQRPVSSLRLFWLPPAAGEHLGEDELAAAVGDFLGEFYAALAHSAGATADSATLARLRAQLGERRPLTAPLPRLRLEDFALTWHFVELLDDGPETDALLREVRALKCPVFHSMESDLLSRAYRTRRLFRTVCLTKPAPPAPADSEAGLAVEIEFPRRIAFQSENRREERRWPRRRRRARALLAPTFFFDARLIVWHLTLKVDAGLPAEDAGRWFDELDLITLLKLTDDAADQEFVRVPADDATTERSVAESIVFRLVEDGGAPFDVNGLLRAVAAVARARLGDAPTPQRALPPAAATVELLGWDVERRRPFFGVADPIAREALCGIIAGILDFDELDDAEARDMLTPSVELDDAFLRVHRETLVYVAQDDRAARTVAGTVGISPYLILPHAAAVCDDWLLRPFESPVMPDAGAVNELSLAVKRREDALRTRWVPNPFFYPTEQRLYERALVEGGTAARRAKEEERLLELKTRLQLAHEAQRAKFEAIVQGLLGAIAVVSADTLLVDVVPWLRGLSPPGTDDKLLGHALTLGLAVLCGLVIFAWKRPRAEATVDSDGATSG